MLNEIPDGWVRRPLAQIAVESKSRFDPSQESRVLPYVGLEHITPGAAAVSAFGSSSDVTSHKTLFRANDILFGKLRPYLHKVAAVDRAGVCSTDVLAIRPKDGTDAGFLLTVLSREETIQYAMGRSAGTKMPRTSWKALGEMDVLVPPLPEQKKIAAILASVDQSIQATEAVIEQTRRVKDGLLQDLLTRGIGHTRFKQTEIGEIPESWEARPVTEVGEVTMGRQKAPKYMTGDFTRPYLRVVNVFDDRLDLSDVAEMDFDSSDFERYHLQRGDVLVTEGDLVSAWNVGRTAVYRDEIDGCCFQNTLIRLRPQHAEDGDFYHLAISSLRVRGYLAKLAAGTTVFHLGSTRFEKVVVPVPPPHERTALVKVFASVDSTLDTAKSKVQRLHQVKAGLLQDLLTGAVRVTA